MSPEDPLVPEPHVIVIFGALGDLSRRKLLPGLFHLDRAGLIPSDYRIVGTSRRGGSADDFRTTAQESIGGEAAGEHWERFADRLRFSAFNSKEPAALVEEVTASEHDLGGTARRLHYLSIPPAGFDDTIRAVGALGLAQRARVVPREALRHRPRQRS